MEKIRKILSFTIIETIFIVFPFLIMWFIFYLLSLNIVVGIVLSILIMFLLNIFFFKKLNNNFFNLNYILLAITHLFLSVCILGFFMGVPVFNMIPGILGGIYVGIRSNLKKETKESFKHNLNIVNLYSTFVLIIVCICSAYLALSDKYTISNLEGMFNLQFHLTNEILWAVIILGGVMLLVTQYFVSKFFARKIYNN